MAFAFQRQVDPENEARMRGYYWTFAKSGQTEFLDNLIARP